MAEGARRRRATGATPLARLLERLALERIDRDLFLGDPGRARAASSVAWSRASRSSPRAEDGTVHSLHAYFLRPGSHGVPIRFVVDRIRDGRSFTTRRVVAHQGGEAIFSLEASFARLEDGIEHEDPMPAAPDPDALRDWEDARAEILRDPAARRRDGPVEVRICDPEHFSGEPKPPRADKRFKRAIQVR